MIALSIMLGGFYGTRLAGNTVYVADIALAVAAAGLLIHWVRRRFPIQVGITTLFLGYWAVSLIVGALFIPREYLVLGLKEHANGVRALIGATWAVHLAWTLSERERESTLRRAFWISLVFLPTAQIFNSRNGNLAAGALDNSLVFLLPVLIYGIHEIFTTPIPGRLVGMSRLLVPVAIALAAVGTAFLYTRGAILGGMAGTGLVLALKPLSGRRAGAALIATALAGASVAAAALAALTVAGDANSVRRLRGIVDSQAVGYGNDGRYAIWVDALGILAKPEHLLTGVGAHNYVFYSGVQEIKDGMVVEPSLLSTTIKQGHNQYLTFAVELGLLGLALFGCILGAAIYRASIHRRSILLVALLLAFAVMNLTGDFVFARAPYLLQVSLLWWFVVAWCLAPRVRSLAVCDD